jgi:hypothetical protein
MDMETRLAWKKEMGRRQSKSMDAPSWLPRSARRMGELMAVRFRTYREALRATSRTETGAQRAPLLSLVSDEG